MFLGRLSPISTVLWNSWELYRRTGGGQTCLHRAKAKDTTSYYWQPIGWQMWHSAIIGWVPGGSVGTAWGATVWRQGNNFSQQYCAYLLFDRVYITYRLIEIQCFLLQLKAISRQTARQFWDGSTPGLNRRLGMFPQTAPHVMWRKQVMSAQIWSTFGVLPSQTWRAVCRDMAIIKTPLGQFRLRNLSTFFVSCSQPRGTLEDSQTVVLHMIPFKPQHTIFFYRAGAKRGLFTN